MFKRCRWHVQMSRTRGTKSASHRISAMQSGVRYHPHKALKRAVYQHWKATSVFACCSPDPLPVVWRLGGQGAYRKLSYGNWNGKKLENNWKPKCVDGSFFSSSQIPLASAIILCYVMVLMWRRWQLFCSYSSRFPVSLSFRLAHFVSRERNWAPLWTDVCKCARYVLIKPHV